MSDGTDGKYYNKTGGIPITSNTTNSSNYYAYYYNVSSYTGNVFEVQDSGVDISNNGIILGAGGEPKSKNGGNGLYNKSDNIINTLTNTGAFLGGGGGGEYNKGGPGGGGPGGNGGGPTDHYPPGISYGPFGGAGGGFYASADSSARDATSTGGGYPNVNMMKGQGSGGGYGGGNAISYNTPYYGAGGGGGGGSGEGDTGTYGNGGYGIWNDGSITTLNNQQGGTIVQSTADSYTYGPLFYTGNLPSNYNIMIKSSSEYGQLWCNGCNSSGVTGNMTFDVYSTYSPAPLPTTITYSSVLIVPKSSNITINTVNQDSPQSITGEAIISGGVVTWTLVFSLTGNYNNYNTYDLSVFSYVCFHPNTKILSMVNGIEDYRIISSLRKGDYVKAHLYGFLKVFGIGKSTMHNHGKNKRVQNCLYKLSQSNFPDLFEDLIITGCHSILVDELTEEQKKI